MLLPPDGGQGVPDVAPGFPAFVPELPWFELEPPLGELPFEAEFEPSGEVTHGPPLGELLGLFGVLGLVVDGGVPGEVEPGVVEPGAVEPGEVEPGALAPGAVEPGIVEFGDPFGEVDPGEFGLPVCGVALPAGGVAVPAGGVAGLPGVADEPVPEEPGAELWLAPAVPAPALPAPPVPLLCATTQVAQPNMIADSAIFFPIIQNLHSVGNLRPNSHSALPRS